MKITTPLRYPGGKSRAVKIIADLIPNYFEFREPFVGGGSVFIYLKQKYPNRKYWINDIYRNLFLFWRQTQQNPQQLIEQILIWKETIKNGRQLYIYLQENIENFDDLKKAAAFFIFNRITFSGTTQSGGFSEAAFNKRFTESSINRVRLLSTILSDIVITNYDYQHVVEADGNNVFIFLDPPYYSATKSALYGKNGHLHKNFDHARLAEILKKTKHKWLLTYDDCSYIRELYSFANIKEWDMSYGMRNVGTNSNQKGKELFIFNYSLKKVNDNTITLFDKFE